MVRSESSTVDLLVSCDLAGLLKTETMTKGANGKVMWQWCGCFCLVWVEESGLCLIPTTWAGELWTEGVNEKLLSVLHSFHVQPISSHLKVQCKTNMKMNSIASCKDDYSHFVAKEFLALCKSIGFSFFLSITIN